MPTNNKALTIWNKLKINEYFLIILDKYRKKLKVPKKGSKNKKILYKKLLSDDVFWKNVNLYLGEVKKIINDDYVFHKFRFFLIDFLLFNEETRINNIDITGIEVYAEKDNSNIDKGVYIKISHSTTINDLKKYIDKRKNYIRTAQKLVYGEKREKRIRYNKYYDRDYIIYRLNKLNKKNLCEINKMDDTITINKESLIARIINEKYKSDISSDNVRKIIYRQRKQVTKNTIM